MKNNNKKGLCLLLIILVSVTMGLGANPIQPWDHEFNPALLSTGERTFLEVGTSVNVAASNSYFTMQQLFPADGVLTIDFNAMMDDLGDKDLKVALSVEAEEHAVLTILGLSLGEYSSVSGAVSTAVPNGVIEAIADGISIGETNEGSGEIYGKVFAKAGMYLGFRWKDWQIGTKAGAFAPIVYTDGDASFTYNVSNGSDGTIHADASASIPFYTMLNITDMEDSDSQTIINSLGYSLDLGLVKMKNKKPHYGFSLTGITLAPAMLPYSTMVTASATMDAADLISYEDNNEPWTTDSDVEDVETLEDLYEVSMPLSVGGFYVLSGFPGFIDWIGTAEVTLDDGDALLGADITAKGAVFPLTALSLTLGYDKFMWESSLGLRFSLHLIEVGLDVGMANTRFVNLFSPSGVSAGLNVAVGL